MDQQPHILAEIAKLTGVSPRAIQSWSVGGVLRPLDETHSGRGKHRRYSADEVEIARVIAVFARRGITIGKLKEISDAIRPFSHKRVFALLDKYQRALRSDLETSLSK